MCTCPVQSPVSPAAARSLLPAGRSAALAMGRKIEILSAGTNRDIDNGFASLLQKRVDALVIGPSNLFANRRVQLTTLATVYAMPTIYSDREFAEGSGLMSYGASSTDQARQVGIDVGGT